MMRITGTQNAPEFWSSLAKGTSRIGPEAAQPNKPTVSKGMEYIELKPSDLPLSEEITTLRFPKKFVMLTFDHYSGTFDPLLHLLQYQDKMAVYAHDDLLLCRAFPSSLKRASYHWFCSLPKNSLQNFHDVIDAFYNHFASRREF